MQEVDFGHIRRVCIRFVAFGHQGAEILSAEGEKMGVLAIFGGFKSLRGPNMW